MIFVSDANAIEKPELEPERKPIISYSIFIRLSFIVSQTSNQSV
jgi:hypothetical protein